jgi:parvulin-like peptidyl-prolyl isomerase
MIRKSFLAAGLIISIVAAGLLISGCNDLPANAAATVDGKVISKDDVNDRIRIGKGLSPGSVPADVESEDYKNFQRDVTEQLVAEELERQEAEKRGITVTANEVNALIDQVIEDKYFGSLQKLQEDFNKRGITEDDLRQELLRRLLHQKIMESLRAEVPANEDEVRAQYEANISSYIYPEKRQVRQIVVADEATARAAASRIAAGEDMATVAKQVSIDSKTRDNGGMVGLVVQSSLPKAVGDVAFSLPASQVSMPFKGDLGWYIVKVELIVPASNRTFDQVKDELMKFAGNQNLSQRYKAYVEEVKDAYDVQYADGYEPRDKTAAVTDETGTETIQMP